MADTTISQPFSGPDQPETLSQATATREISETLESHITVLQQLIPHLRQQVAREEQGLRESQAKRAALEAKHRTEWTTLSSLDLKWLEKIPPDKISGQTSWAQSKSVFSVRPTFKFSLVSQYPIRSWERKQSDGVTWDLVVCPEGGRNLSTKARGKSRAAATAEIVLMGWRKDIHKDEIDRLRVSIADLDKGIQAEADAGSRQSITLSAKRRELNETEGQAASCKDALTVLEHSSNYPPSARAALLLAAGSVSGYAASILGPTVLVDSASASLGPSLEYAMGACQRDMGSAKSAMDGYCGHNNWASTGAGKAELEAIDAKIRNALSIVAIPDEAAPPDPGSDDLTALLTESYEDVVLIKAAMLAVDRDLAAEVRQLQSGQKDISGSNSELAVCSGIVRRWSDGMGRTCTWLKAKKQPVGVAAAMRSPRNLGPAALVYAFLLIYKGEEMGRGPGTYM